jgi:type III restriction enzyme
LPVHILHRNIIAARKNKTTRAQLFNDITIKNIIKKFDAKFRENFVQKFSYHRLDYTANTSIFTKDGDFVNELTQGKVGDKIAHDIGRTRENYLYDKYVYDSEIEHEVLKVESPERVVVYGKLPQGSIKLPTYTGGTTSPDFVYAIQNKNSNDIELHLIVETKSDNPHLSDEIAVKSQKKAFDKIDENANIKWKMETDVKKFESELKKLAGN